MKQIAKFVSIKIKNFKNLKEFNLSLEKLNELYGANKTGKSSVLEAIHFACKGGKNDVEKIRVGADKAEVVLEAEEQGVPIEIKTTINRKGNVYCSGKVNGVATDSPRSLISRLLTFGTFNPREMLDKKDRLSRLLKLIPIYIKDEKELSVPEMNVDKFPIANPMLIDFDKHAFYVLEGLDKDLRNTRLSKGREKDYHLKAYEKRKEDLDSACIMFQKNYGKDPLTLKKTHEDKIREQERIATEKDIAQENSQKLKETIGIQERNVSELEKARQDWENKLAELMHKVALVKGEISKGDEKVKMIKEDLKKLKDGYNERYEKFKFLESKMATFDTDLKQSREAERLQNIKKELVGQKEEADEKEADWKAFDMLIKKAFPLLQNKILAPIQKLVPGLVISDGKFTYNDIPIDSLSGSEVISLSMKLMALQENSNILLINEGEALDEESIKKANFEDFSTVIVARVGNKPLDGWNSIKMNKKEG